jgi:D-alanine transfer protein
MTAHLRPAGRAVLIVASALVLGDLEARRCERSRVHAVASLMFQQKNQGTALQKEAFRHDDLLPLYGSSELLVWRSLQRPFMAREVFRDYPTGFTVFPVGRPKNTCLLILQKLAGVGAALRGRKVAIVLSPVWFVNTSGVDGGGYAGNFSALQAHELAFGSLSLGLKRDAARRMLDYPHTLHGSPVLRFCLERLAAGGGPSLAAYLAAWPLGWLETVVLRLQDHWQTHAYFSTRPDLDAVQPRHGEAIDWPGLMDRAEQAYAPQAAGNPYGFDAKTWRRHGTRFDGRRRLSRLRRNLRESREWQDLELLLRGLRELGAQPLLLCGPLHGPYYDSLGFGPRDRALCYDRIRVLCRAYGVPAVVLSDHDGDRDFAIDPWTHPSPKGWVWYDRVLDAFHRGAAVAAEAAARSLDAVLPLDPAGPDRALR